MNNNFTRENAAEWTSLDHAYIVIDEPNSLSCAIDCREEVFRTLEEANEYAADQWRRLTPFERKSRRIHVYRVERYSLSKELYSDEGMPIDWKAYDWLDSNDGGFDSEEAARRESAETEDENE